MPISLVRQGVTEGIHGIGITRIDLDHPQQVLFKHIKPAQTLTGHGSEIKKLDIFWLLLNHHLQQFKEFRFVTPFA